MTQKSSRICVIWDSQQVRSHLRVPIIPCKLVVLKKVSSQSFIHALLIYSEVTLYWPNVDGKDVAKMMVYCWKRSWLLDSERIYSNSNATLTHWHEDSRPLWCPSHRIRASRYQFLVQSWKTATGWYGMWGMTAHGERCPTGIEWKLVQMMHFPMELHLLWYIRCISWSLDDKVISVLCIRWMIVTASRFQR